MLPTLIELCVALAAFLLLGLFWRRDGRGALRMRLGVALHTFALRALLTLLAGCLVWRHITGPGPVGVI